MLVFDPEPHLYTWNGATVPSVTQIIASALGSPFEKVAAPVLELARQRGKAVHRARDLDDEGRLDVATVDARIWPYIEAWRDFRRDWPCRILFSEKPLYSPLYGYAGTPDVVVETDRFVAVVDGKTGLPFGANMQTAGYAQLIAENFRFAPIRRFALRMTNGGKYRLVEYDAISDWRDFLACVNVCRLKNQI